MIATIAGYTLGYALLNPAFIEGLGLWTVLGLDTIYIVVALVLIVYLGRKVRAEHTALERLEAVTKQLAHPT